MLTGSRRRARRRVELIVGAIVEVLLPDADKVERVELELDKSLPYERVASA
jgi:hypothetical protein